MNRRGFLAGFAGFLASPAIVRASSLMPVSVQPLFTSHMGTWQGVQIVETRTLLVSMHTGPIQLWWHARDSDPAFWGNGDAAFAS